MKIHYKNNRLKKSITTDEGLSKTYSRLAKKIKQRRSELESAENLAVIAKLPQLRLHPYKGKQAGIWSIDIQENWRILFTIDHTPIPTLADGGINLKAITILKIISVEDPH